MSTQSSHKLREKQSKTLVTQIQQIDWFCNLTAQIDKLQHLQKLFEKVVDIDLGTQCQVLEIKNECLLIQVDNAIWATALRYQAPELIKKLQKIPEFMGIKKIRTQIYHNPWPQPLTVAKPNAISSASAISITAVADSIKDTELRQMMLQLGRK